MVNANQSLSAYLSSVPQACLQRNYNQLYGKRETRSDAQADMGVHIHATSCIRLTDLVLDID